MCESSTGAGAGLPGIAPASVDEGRLVSSSPQGSGFRMSWNLDKLHRIVEKHRSGRADPCVALVWLEGENPLQNLWCYFWHVFSRQTSLAHEVRFGRRASIVSGSNE